MTWELAHRADTSDPATYVERDEASSAEAIDAVRANLPEGHRILFVRRK